MGDQYMTKLTHIFAIILLGLFLVSCGGGGSVSTLPTSDAFDESDLDFNPKMDILWVVDPSKSMYEEVENVRNNIQAFITDFITNGYEYRMGVISTAAWSDEAYQANTSLDFLVDADGPVFARLHKGECVEYPAASNARILDHLNAGSIGQFTTRFQSNFDVYGVKLNTSGCGLVGAPFGNWDPVTNNIFGQGGYDNNDRYALWEYVNDERPLQSVRAFLEYDSTLGAGEKFVRDDAYLAIIIISDEQDASRDSLTPALGYAPGNPGNHTAAQYVSYISSIKESSPGAGDGLSRFGIYSIVDLNQTGNIDIDAAQQSGGLAFDINASQAEYIANLNSIKDAILTEATAYPLACRPVVSSIEIEILKQSGVLITVPRDTGSGGWTYISASQSVSFSPSYLPAKEDVITVNYTPATLNCGYGNSQPRIVLSNNQVYENSPNGTVVGTVSFINGDGTGGTYTIQTDTSAGGFAIDGVTGEVTIANTLLLDTETKSNEQIEVRLTLPDTTTFDKSFTIRILDVADSVPVANDDSYSASESAADLNGDITIIGNVSYNDTGIDASEVHTFANTSSPAEGALTFNSNGSFTYVVNVADFSPPLGSGDSSVQTFNYSLTDAATNTDSATVTITISGENQKPVLTLAIPDQNVVFDGGVIKVPMVAGDISVSGTASGTIANLIDGNQGTGHVTSSSGAHYIEMEFPSSSPLFEVQEFRIRGGHSLGNAILQVRAADDRVLTREVLPVDQAGSDNLTISMTDQVIGAKARLIRSVGSVNPSGDQNLNINEIEIWGIEAEITEIDLDNHFSDPDVGDTLTYYATDIYGEGPAPGWVTIAADKLRFVPPSGTDIVIGILAQDPSGATEFTTVRITREGSGDITNSAPISLLAVDDEKRGGMTLRRFGGGTENAGNPAADNSIRHGEGDNFIIDPYVGQDLRDILIANPIKDLGPSTYRCTSPYSCIPADTRADLIAAGYENQLAHFGDNYGSENGWSITPVHVDNKYPLGSFVYCSGDPSTSPPSPAVVANGRIIPCVNTSRSYGETYTSYFVPAKTGVYRFRSPTQVDDIARLLLAPTEYVEDLVPVFTTHHPGVSNLINSLYDITGDTHVANGEFSPNSHRSGGHDTSIFYEPPVVLNQGSYRKGYVYLEQGNVYALEIRFQEGGGTVQFAFEYNRKDIDCNPTNSQPSGSCWDGWKAIDASVMVPEAGSDAHTPRVISGPAVSFDAKNLFYDAEEDALDYTARLVNADGTVFTDGPSGNGSISDIGLVLGVQNGILSGTLNATYDTHKPRVVFKAQERHTSAHAEVESLPIKFSP